MAETQFLALLDSNRAQVESLLPKYLTPERFFTLARLIEQNAQLKQCTPQSLFDCVLKAAQCGLEIGTVDQHSYIIPYGKEAQFQPSYRGMIFRLVQAGVVANMYAEVICENDPPPRIISGTQRQLVHEFAVGKRGKTVGAYSVATMPNGSTDFELMNDDDIASIERAALRISGGKPSPAWQMFRNEMIKKSVIKRHAKRLQGDRRGLIKDDEATRLDMTFEATQRIDGDAPPDDIPIATDGTHAPTPRRAKVEVVDDAGASGKKKPSPSSTDAPHGPDRLLNDQEQNDLYDGWGALGGKGTALKKFLEANFQVDDLAKLKLSQVNDVIQKMESELAA